MNQFLTFDGTHLGYYKLEDCVKWWYIFTLEGDKGNNWFFVYFSFGGHYYTVLMRRFSKLYVSNACIIDELKVLYGLNKFGTHQICLDKRFHYDNGSWGIVKGKTTFVIFRTETFHRPDRCIEFYQPITLKGLILPENYEDVTDEQVDLLKQVQKILLFRELVGVHHKGLESMVVIGKKVYSLDFSLIDMSSQIKMPSTSTSYQIFPELWTKQRLLERMQGFCQQNYDDHLDRLKLQLEDVISRIDKTKLDRIPWLIRNIDMRMVLYYENENSYEKT